MADTGRVLALIPARGGSKGLPGKNLRPLAGHPLIAWSIAAARAARGVDRIVCSTDSDEIAAIARRYGAETPFLRPAGIAGDRATDLEVFDHALARLAAEGDHPALFVQLRPTTPFRRPEWIGAAIDRMRADATISAIRSVAPARHTPYKMWTISDAGLLAPFVRAPGGGQGYDGPRQSLPPVHWHSGQLDVIRADTIRAGSMSGDRIAAFEVPAEGAVDIDGLDDFLAAEALFDRYMPPAIRAAIAC